MWCLLLTLPSKKQGSNHKSAILNTVGYITIIDIEMLLYSLQKYLAQLGNYLQTQYNLLPTSIAALPPPLE